MANRSATTVAMCGIFGFVAAPGTAFDLGHIRPFLRDLFRLSEPRGQEASGLAIAVNDEIRVFKRGLAPSVMLASDAYRNFLDQALVDGESVSYHRCHVRHFRFRCSVRHGI